MSSQKLLIIGGVLGLITVVLVNLYLGQVRSQQREVALLRLAPGISLPRGDVVTEDLLVTEYLPEQFGSITRLAVADSPETRAWVLNRRVNQDIEPGAFLLHQFFIDEPKERFTAKITENMRAMTVPVDPSGSVAYLVDPGSRVDVIGTFEEPPSEPPPRPPRAMGNVKTQEDMQRVIAAQAAAQLHLQSKVTRTRTILQNVRVLAVGQATTRRNYLGLERGSFSTVTLEVDPLQAETLAFALTQARAGLRLILRNPADDQTAEVPSVSWENLAGTH